MFNDNINFKIIKALENKFYEIVLEKDDLSKKQLLDLGYLIRDTCKFYTCIADGIYARDSEGAFILKFVEDLSSLLSSDYTREYFLKIIQEIKNDVLKEFYNEKENA